MKLIPTVSQKPGKSNGEVAIASVSPICDVIEINDATLLVWLEEERESPMIARDIYHQA